MGRWVGSEGEAVDCSFHSICYEFFIEVYRRAARAGEEGAGSSAVAEESRFLSVTVGRASYTSAISISWDRAWPKQ